LYARFLREHKLAPLDVIGFSLGGWIAAQMAAANHNQFRRMVLVAPPGIRPPQGKGELMAIFHKFPPAQLPPGWTRTIPRVNAGNSRVRQGIKADVAL